MRILGTGCPRCKRLEQLARDAAEESGVHATFTKLTKMDEILDYQILSTPGLVIDEQLKSSGRLPARAEMVGWLRGAQS